MHQNLIQFLFVEPKTVDECYEIDNNPQTLNGIKDSNGDWNVYGDRSRLIHITEQSLKSYVGLLDDEKDWQKVRMPMLFQAKYQKQ